MIGLFNAPRLDIHRPVPRPLVTSLDYGESTYVLLNCLHTSMRRYRGSEVRLSAHACNP